MMQPRIVRMPDGRVCWSSTDVQTKLDDDNPDFVRMTVTMRFGNSYASVASNETGTMNLLGDTSEFKAIACNYAVNTKKSKQGAIAWVMDINVGNGSDRLWIIARSHGGRWIEIWEDSRRLTNFRVKTIVPEKGKPFDKAMPLLDGNVGRIDAIEWCKRMNTRANETGTRNVPGSDGTN